MAQRLPPCGFKFSCCTLGGTCPLGTSAPSRWWWGNYHHAYFLFIRKKITNAAGFLKKADLVSVWLHQTFILTWTSKLNLFPQALSWTHLQVNIPPSPPEQDSLIFWWSKLMETWRRECLWARTRGSLWLAEWCVWETGGSAAWIVCGELEGVVVLPCTMERVHDTVFTIAI